jgi:hypothetical protein
LEKFFGLENSAFGCVFVLNSQKTIVGCTCKSILRACGVKAESKKASPTRGGFDSMGWLEGGQH